MQVKEGRSGESPAGKWADVPTPVPEIASWGNLLAYSPTEKSIQNLYRATSGNPGFYLGSTIYLILTSEMGLQALPTCVYGPLLRDTKGLLLGKSNTNIQGIFLAPGVINADFEGEIKVMTHSSNGILSIKQAFLYNSQGQGIVEPDHASLKIQLQKIKTSKLYP